MGIKDLWTILAPFCDRKPLYELQGKKVAVDLSCWICEAQNVADYSVQPRMYLRNLYFRTCYLLLMDVYPVFVLEGEAPELKHDTIATRNAIQFKGARPKREGVKTGKGRTRFHFVLKQCQEMLDTMGIDCIQGNGEAESLCAYLNEDGLVHGCISQDSDCFAYGAKVVYRNFSISSQGAYAASGGAVDVYDITKANAALQFGRNKIIALALLCGSDYNGGVHGIGKDSALKLFERFSDEEILDRLRSWRENKSLFEEFDNKINNKNICTSCGHSGKLQSHNKIGCNACNTNKGCNFTKYRDERLQIKNELNIRTKALQNPEFPNEDLIKEFLHRKDNVKHLNFNWKQPNMVKFIKIATKYLTWEELYAFEKLLPILTRWQLLNYNLINGETQQEAQCIKGILFPTRIKKIRNPKGIASYEIIWNDKENYFKGLIPDEQLADIDLEKLYSTIEPQSLVEKAYPQLVYDYQQSKIKPKKITKRKIKTKVDEITEQLQNTSITKPVSNKRMKKQVKKITQSDMIDLENSFSSIDIQSNKNKQKTLDQFINKVITSEQHKKDLINSNSQGKQILTETINCSTPRKINSEFLFDLDSSNFGDENDSDVSEIVENIMEKNQYDYVEKKLEQMGLKCFEDNAVTNKNSFFVTEFIEEDLFEHTFKKDLTLQNNSNNDTDEYEFDEKNLGNINCPNFKDNLGEQCSRTAVQEKQSFEMNTTLEDSFESQQYIPLYQRLQLKK